jgi:hypothetical protein
MFQYVKAICQPRASARSVYARKIVLIVTNQSVQGKADGHAAADGAKPCFGDAVDIQNW